MRECAWSTEATDKWWKTVLFKWIPTDVDRNKKTWAVRLTPFIESTGKTEDDGRGTFNTHFTVRKINSPI